MPLHLKDRFVNYLDPIFFLWLSLQGLLRAILSRLLAFNLDALCSISKLKDLAFASVWLKSGPDFAANDELNTCMPSLVRSAYGTVLELGPGSGNQLPRFDKSKVTKIYGVEPNMSLHAALATKLKDTHLEGVYEIIPNAVEDHEELAKRGIHPGSIDTILSVQVLCSVPEPEVILKELYALLKPGGQLIMFEHIASADVVSKVVQGLYDIPWSYAMGSCHLRRPTDVYAIRAGAWDEIKLDYDGKPWMLFPHVFGRLIKSKLA